jgi:hypothetical protein
VRFEFDPTFIFVLSWRQEMEINNNIIIIMVIIIIIVSYSDKKIWVLALSL